MMARSEPCGCHDVPHRRLIVESGGLTLLSCCEWSLWLLRFLYRDTPTCWGALVAAGLEPTEPDPEWRKALQEMED